MVQLEFSYIFTPNGTFFVENDRFLLRRNEGKYAQNFKCLKNPLSVNYDVGQNVQSVKIAIGQNCRRSKLPSVKNSVGKNCHRSKLLSVKIAVGQNGRRLKLRRSKDLEPQFQL
jgi:hypothetical protein